MEEKILYRKHLPMIRNNPIGFSLLFLISITAAVGLITPFRQWASGLLLACIVIFFFWWLKAIGITLTITDRRTILRRGILSKHTNEVLHSDVSNVQVRQGPIERLLDVGNIGISTAAQAGFEIEIHGISDPDGVWKLINQYRGA